jgi:uncharacterized protein DUF4267
MVTSNRFAARGIEALAVMRIAAGLLAWFNPRLTARSFGLACESDESHYAWRLFGIRDVMLGLGTLRSSDAQRRAFATAALACDAADGAAGAISMYRNHFTRPAAGAPVLVPAVAVAFGVWALRVGGS